MKNKTTRKKKYVRKPSAKMLAHLRRLHKLIKSRTRARRAAEATKRAGARARYHARRGATPASA